MGIVLNAFQSVLSIVIMIALGYFLTRKGFFDESVSQLFAKLVINVSLPALMISSLLTVFDREKLYSAGNGIIIPVASMLICYAVAIVVAKLIRIKPERKGIFQAMFFASNTIFMGMPVNLALFGEQSTPYVLFYYAANTTLFWTIGVYGIGKDKKGSEEKLFSINTVKRLFSAPLLGLLAGLLLVLLGIQLPSFIMDSCKYLGNLTTPLSLLFIGITFSTINIKDIKLDKDMTALLLGRFVISPLVVYALALVIPISGLMTKVFIIQSAMPIITQSAIAAKAYDVDYRYATVMVTVTTVLSILFIPVYMVLMSGI
ncbi:MAG: malate transporter [Clostridia bacterium BRH_c25]|nr:MAG: malate transporter [Clostridia bacterium BRH_c25]